MSIAALLMAVGVGIMTGGVTSLIGASGVMIIVPALTMLFHIGAHSAIGTSLFVDVIASATVSFSYFRHGNIEIRSGLWIALSSIAGAQLGAFLSSGISEASLSGAFGVFLAVSGIGLLIKSRREKTDAPAQRKSPFTKKWQKIAASVVIGLGIGVISGLLGAGGGVMVLLALVLILAYPLHRAIGTSTLIMAMTALSSALGYAARGNIDLKLGCLLAAGAVAGGLIGSKFANRVSERTLQCIVSICFMAMGAAMTAMEIIKAA
jgi:uncharacterized membrane protein YfcA